MPANIIFLGNGIISGKIKYTTTITKRTDLKTDLDSYLTQQGRSDLIV